MKDSLHTLRFDELDRKALRTVSATLGLDMSSTIRFLLRREEREIEARAALALPAPAKKRRSSAA